MSSFQDYMKLGQEIGLEKEELLEFAREREAAAREERAQTRALEKARCEAQEKASEDAKQIELARLTAQQESSQKQWEFELERAKLQAEVEKERLQHGVGKVESGRGIGAEKPKLPAFDAKRDSFDAYLARFERYATSQYWPPEEWCINLSALLTGKALDVYCRLSPKDADSYLDLKSALLKAFECTEEGFRLKFRNAKLEIGETYPQFGARLEHMLERWVDLSGTYKTYDELKDLLLREQVMTSSHKELATFLR